MSYNKIVLEGYVGKEPYVSAEVKSLMMSFSVATNSKFKKKDPETGNMETVEKTHWHECVCFGKLAELAKKSIHKGSHVLVEGELTYDRNEKNGNVYANASIKVSELRYLDKKSEAKTTAAPAADVESDNAVAA